MSGVFKSIIPVSVALTMLSQLSGGPRAATEALPPDSFRQLLDAVVRIDVWERRFEGGQERTVRGVGSGAIMSADGHILTNAHVVSPDAVRIQATLASLERVEASLVGWDHWTDLAVIQLDMEDLRERGLGFEVADFGESESLEPAQTVFAVGTPNGLTRTVTRGIISNTNRFFEGASIRGYETGYFNTWLQTDAAINPGNSGGPLVTALGAVVGINTRGYMGADNLGFAVPGSIARSVMKELITEGEIVRSYIGITPGPLQDLEAFYQLEMNRGMLVQSVDPGSPADEAGVRPGDIVLSIDGEAVDGRFPEQLPPILKRIAEKPVGAKVVLEIQRGGEPRTVEVITERLRTRVGEEWVFDDWGLSVRAITRAESREQKLDEAANGVRITGVQQAFPGDQAGLRPGDIITGVNRKELRGLEELKEIYREDQENPAELLLEVSRDFATSYVVLKP
jgi:serine protease Do